MNKELYNRIIYFLLCVKIWIKTRIYMQILWYGPSAISKVPVDSFFALSVEFIQVKFEGINGCSEDWKKSSFSFLLWVFESKYPRYIWTLRYVFSVITKLQSRKIYLVSSSLTSALIKFCEMKIYNLIPRNVKLPIRLNIFLISFFRYFVRKLVTCLNEK